MSEGGPQKAVMLDASQAYARWAPSYDRTPNPLLALEERLLRPVLGTLVTGGNVVEHGCGTGRWLRVLEGMGPRSLTGVDSSHEMLAEADKNCSPSTILIEADCTSSSLPNKSADCVLASFVLSYIRDLKGFGAECARILRPRGTLIISDLHPNTPLYGWRRTFRVEEELFEVATFPYTLSELVTVMGVSGLKLLHLNEAGFGKEQEAIFRLNGMRDTFHQVESLPVIYWAQFSMGN
jgi:ubiquinone/menaquinone biosynthesis C-methylase UbiE